MWISSKVRLSLATLVLASCVGCSVLLDKVFSGASPRPPAKELAFKQQVISTTSEKVGTVDTGKSVEAMKESLQILLIDPCMNSKHKLKALLAFYRYTDKIDGSSKLEFYETTLREGLASGDPSKFLAGLQMMQMQTLRNELESRLPQLEEGIEKGIGWLIPLAGGGGGVLAVAGGLLIYFMRLLHRSNPTRV